MANKAHTYLVVGDGEDDYGIFKIEYNGLNVFIDNTLDERFSLRLNKSDWEVMKTFIDEQFSKGL